MPEQMMNLYTGQGKKKKKELEARKWPGKETSLLHQCWANSQVRRQV